LWWIFDRSDGRRERDDGMRRIAATVMVALSMATVLAAPAHARPVCSDRFGICDTLCRKGIVC
jgi:hypothetical protein